MTAAASSGAQPNDHDLRASRSQPKDEILFTVAVHLGVEYLAGHDITRRSLSEAMTAAFGATDASGLWSMRDAYDAMEAAQVLAIKTMPESYDSEHASTLARLIARSSTLRPRPIAAKARSNSSSFRPPRRSHISLDWPRP